MLMTPEQKKKYDHLIGELMVQRYRYVFYVAAFLHLLFVFGDYQFYPTQVWTFLKIRLFDVFLIFIIYLLTFVPRFQKHIRIFSILGGVIVSGGMIAMIHLTDGVYSHYYEGVNIVLLGTLFLNIFYPRDNLIGGLIQVALYNLAIFVNHNPTTAGHLIFFNNYFMLSTLAFVVMITWLYSQEHQKSFVQSEQLKSNQKYLAVMYRKAETKAKLDPLTHILNRGAFMKSLQHKIVMNQTQKSHFYLVLFDIDHFKQVNDTYGHGVGDQVILRVVEAVKENMRPESLLGRYGGDEFMILFEGVSQEVIIRRMEQIAEKIKAMEFRTEIGNFHVSASFGVARFDPDKIQTESQLIEIADQALLGVKRTHRGDIHFAA